MKLSSTNYWQNTSKYASEIKFPMASNKSSRIWPRMLPSTFVIAGRSMNEHNFLQLPKQVVNKTVLLHYLSWGREVPQCCPGRGLGTSVLSRQGLSWPGGGWYPNRVLARRVPWFWGTPPHVGLENPYLRLEWSPTRDWGTPPHLGLGYLLGRNLATVTGVPLGNDMRRGSIME